MLHTASSGSISQLSEIYLRIDDGATSGLGEVRANIAYLNGYAPETVTQWMKAAGLDVVLQRSLVPEPASEGKIAVSLWLGRDPRITLAAPALEVA